MCTSPPCPEGCRGTGTTGRVRQQRMLRAYVRVYGAGRKRHTVPVGWWCPGCHAFRTDLP